MILHPFQHESILLSETFHVAINHSTPLDPFIQTLFFNLMFLAISISLPQRSLEGKQEK